MAESPKKTPAKKTAQLTDLEFRVLLHKNIEKMRVWYAKQPTHGQELGHYTMTEIILGNLSVAMEHAMEGKEWEPA